MPGRGPWVLSVIRFQAVVARSLPRRATRAAFSGGREAQERAARHRRRRHSNPASSQARSGDHKDVAAGSSGTGSHVEMQSDLRLPVFGAQLAFPGACVLDPRVELVNGRVGCLRLHDSMQASEHLPSGATTQLDEQTDGVVELLSKLVTLLLVGPIFVVVVIAPTVTPFADVLNRSVATPTDRLVARVADVARPLGVRSSGAGPRDAAAASAACTKPLSPLPPFDGRGAPFAPREGLLDRGVSAFDADAAWTPSAGDHRPFVPASAVGQGELGLAAAHAGSVAVRWQEVMRGHDLA